MSDTTTNISSIEQDDVEGFTFWLGVAASAVVTAADKMGAFDSLDIGRLVEYARRQSR